MAHSSLGINKLSYPHNGPLLIVFDLLNSYSRNRIHVIPEGEWSMLTVVCMLAVLGDGVPFLREPSLKPAVPAKLRNEIVTSLKFHHGLRVIIDTYELIPGSIAVGQPLLGRTDSLEGTKVLHSLQDMD